MPARTFVLADRLDVDVSTCAATVWYLPADPGAVHVLLARSREETTTVAISLELLTRGMYSRVDRDQTTVWPCGEDDVVCVGLRGFRHAVVELPRSALATFLAEIPPDPTTRWRRWPSRARRPAGVAGLATFVASDGAPHDRVDDERDPRPGGLG